MSDHICFNQEGEQKGNKVLENGAAAPLAAASLIRSHSISNDLHGVQPDPVAADILRKEPEQESFIKLLTAPHEIPSPDEIEVYKLLQKCLELRDCYLFREEVAPWEKEVINDPCTPKPDPNPFTYVPEPKSEHVFQMVDGVVHVYADKDCNEHCPLALLLHMFDQMLSISYDSFIFLILPQIRKYFILLLMRQPSLLTCIICSV
jgi:AMP deaminase